LKYFKLSIDFVPTIELVERSYVSAQPAVAELTQDFSSNLGVENMHIA